MTILGIHVFLKEVTRHPSCETPTRLNSHPLDAVSAVFYSCQTNKKDKFILKSQFYVENDNSEQFGLPKIVDPTLLN